ncbi:MAG: ABC transporter ATP-binding protein [Oscillospiraceae bacterium]|nr:ABC transporter ATP-binding protein [Oscillospiraceae bacterium]
MKSLLKYFDGYKKYLFLGPFFKLLEAIFELIVPLVTAKIIDTGIGNNDKDYIIKMGGVMILLGISGLAFALTCQFFAAKCAYGYATSLRKSLYKHINTLSHAEINKLGASTLITRLTNDTNAVQTGVNMGIRLATRSPFLIIGAVIMAVSIDLKLSLILIGAAPIIAFIVYKVMSKSIPMYKQNQKRLDKVSLLTSENLEGTRVIRAFSRQKEEIDEFSSTSDDLSKHAVIVSKISAVLNPANFMILNLAAALIIWFGGIRVDTGSLTQGEITALINYMTQISLSLVVLANLIVFFNKAAAGANRITEIFSINSSLTDGKEDIVATGDTVLEFSDVSFRYPDASEESVSNISFTLKKGETLGIIGGTGSGKTTIANIIPRFFDVTSGEIKIYGKNIKEYKISSIRKMIASVPQKVSVISGTVAENIRMGNKSATDDEVIDALKTAQAYEFIEKLPDKINAPVLQGGKNFSGGQKQRLTIARAIAAKPKILILDDSTSALDMTTDLNLRRAIADLPENPVVIMISQRATSLKNADKILVLEDGKAVGFGTHDYLCENCEVYSEIVEIQKAGE